MIRLSSLTQPIMVFLREEGSGITDFDVDGEVYVASSAGKDDEPTKKTNAQKKDVRVEQHRREN